MKFTLVAYMIVESAVHAFVLDSDLPHAVCQSYVETGYYNAVFTNDEQIVDLAGAVQVCELDISIEVNR